MYQQMAFCHSLKMKEFVSNENSIYTLQQHDMHRVIQFQIQGPRIFLVWYFIHVKYLN